jgi:hypothetical protein
VVAQVTQDSQIEPHMAWSPWCCDAGHHDAERGGTTQGEEWRIVRAEYGTRSQHGDVTDILKDLIARGA